MRTRAPFLASSLLLAFLAGSMLLSCTKEPPIPDHILVDPPGGSSLLDMNTYAADALAANLWNRLRKDETMVTVSLVNLKQLDDTSPLGLVSSQQIASRLAQFGYSVVEGRLKQNISFRVEEGEFMLTREAARLMSMEYQAGAALVGCYLDTGARVFISVRVVRLEDGVILAAYEYYLPKQDDVARLLKKSTSSEYTNAFWYRYSTRPPAISQ